MATEIIRIDLKKPDWWICILLVAYNFFSKYPFISTRDLSWDEPFSTFYSQYSVRQIITELFKGDNPPLYELFLHFYTAVFGISEFALRMPSVLFSCGTVAFLYFAGTRLKGRWTGIFVALLFTFNNLQFFYSLATRMYALFSMLVAASVYLNVVCYQEPSKKKYFYGLLLVNVLMCYTHYFAGFVILAQGLAWLVTFKNKIYFKNAFFVFVANALLVVPLLFVFKMRATGYVNAFEFTPPVPETLKNAFLTLINGSRGYTAAFYFLAIGLAAYIVVSVYKRKIDFRNIFYFILLFLLIALPLAYTWFYSNTYPLFVDRYYLYVTIPLFLFCAISISTFLKPLGSILVPVFFIYFLTLYYRNFTRLNTDYLLRELQGATHKAKQLQQARANSIILISPLWADLGFSYYYDRKLYKSGNNYNSDLSKYKVYRVWTSDSLSRILDQHKGCDVVLYCDEKFTVDSTNDGNFRMLQLRGYMKDTSYFFPQCTTVIKFHPGDSITSK